VIIHHPANARGLTRTDWLDSRHSFSFGRFYNPARMGFGPLRVLNEDRVAPGGGFAPHRHANMEILTWVIDGALAHRDSLGNGSVIQAGDLQRMSAGHGIEHSEYNASTEAPVHFVQIWIQPDRVNGAPRYAQRHFEATTYTGHLAPIAARDGRAGAIELAQDVVLYVARLAADEAVSHGLDPGRRAWVQVLRGTLALGDLALVAGDGAAVDAEDRVVLRTCDAAEFLLFDLPG